MDQIRLALFSGLAVVSMRLVIFALGAILYLGCSTSAWANQWPSWVDGNYPLIRSFAKGHSASFAGVSPGITLPAENLERSGFTWINLGEAWNRPLSCGAKARPSGYIQTDSFRWVDDSEPVRLAVPILLSLKFSNETIKNQMALHPIFNLYLLQVNKTTNRSLYSKVSVDRISIDDCLKRLPSSLSSQASASSSDEEIHVENVCLSRVFQIDFGATYQVRVEWNGDQLCGEINDQGDRSFRVGLGDQFRIVADPSVELTSPALPGGSNESEHP